MSANVVSVVGWLLLGLAVAALLPMVIAIAAAESGAAVAFVGSIGVFAALGGLAVLSSLGRKRRATRRDGLVLSGLIWPIVGLAGSVPFYLSGIGLSVSDAAFEGMSAITTTGATLLGPDEPYLRSLTLWRSLLNWLGGLAAIVLAIGIISTLGARALPIERPQLTPLGSSEVEGTLFSWLTHNGWRVARIYGGITAVIAVIFMIEGLDGISAVCLAMSGISTSGTLPAGTASVFSTPAIEFAVMIAMLTGSCNFVLLTGAARKIPQRLVSDAEMRAFFVILVLIVVLIALYRYLHADETTVLPAALVWIRRLWLALFDGVSLISTTGWSATPAGERALPPVLVVGAVLLGGAAISSAGGLKQMRFLLLIAFSGRELERLSHPHGVKRLRLRGQIVDEGTIDAVWPYFAALILSIALMTVLLSLAGHDFISGLSFATAVLTNSGPMVAMVDGATPNYAQVTVAVKWLLMVGMVLGRIEILVLLALFGPAYQR